MSEVKRKEQVKGWLVERASLVQDYLKECDEKAKSKKLLALAKEAEASGLYAKSSGLQAIKTRIRGQVERLELVGV